MASAKELPPGGEGKIDVTFKTGSGSGGKRQKRISVTTNDPENKRVSLFVKTTVVVKLGVSPRRISFSQVKKGREHVRYASISGKDKDRTKLTGIVSPNSSIKVEINPEGYKGKKDQQIKVTLLPTIRPGRFYDRVTIHTNHKEMKDITLYVTGYVTGDIAVIPRQLHFGLFRPGKAVKRMLRLNAAEDVTFNILGVKASIADVTTRVETVEAGKKYRIHAELKDSFAGDSLKGKLIITTDLKQDPVLEIAILGRKLLSRPALSARGKTATKPSQAAKKFTVFPPPPDKPGPSAGKTAR